jgi:cobalt/nickel transport system ATP-binding protein
MLLKFERVSYAYTGGQDPAIADLSIEIPTGKRCALIGQNGCGKTTLFLLANGLYKPQQGQIFWQQQPLKYDRSSLLKLRQQVGLVFQNPEQQIVATTVEEDISYGLYNLGLSTPIVAERVQQALIDFNLTELAQTPIHHLSLGQKKRVSIADVMVLRPELLLLDEPTAYLDPRHTRLLLATLQQIHATGTTIVMATHDLDLVYRWADWVLVMDRGKLVLAGTPAEIFSQRETLAALEIDLPIAVELLNEIQLLIDSAITTEAKSGQFTLQDIPQLKYLHQRLWQKIKNFD